MIIVKEVKHYICEICNTEYNNKCSCEQCEKSHKKIAKVKAAHYISVTKIRKDIRIRLM